MAQYFIHYQSDYAHLICQDGDLPWGAPNYKFTCSGVIGFARSCDELNALYPHCDSVYAQ